MKFRCNAKSLSDAVSAAAKIINTHSTIPVLSNLLIETKEDTISIQGTDLEITLQRTIDATGAITPGRATVPARIFSTYLSNLGNGAVEIEAIGKKVILKVNKSVVEFNSLSADEYPPIPTSNETESLSIEAKMLKNGVNSTIFAASREEARGSVLMGTLVEIKDNIISLVATDGYRLARWESHINAPGIERRYIVPSKALFEATRSADDNAQISIHSVGENGDQLSFNTPDGTVIVRLVNGQYPAFENVLPKSYDRSITVNTKEFISALKRASLLSDTRASAIKIVSEGESLLLTASSDISGSAYEEISIIHEGEPVNINFNSNHLLEVLTHIDEEKVRLEFQGPLAAASIKGVKNEDLTKSLYLVMPLRS